MIDKNKKVLYINGRFLTQPITGVQRYSREILSTIDQMVDSGELSIPDRLKIICLIPNQPYSDPYWNNIKIKKIGILKNNLWEQIDLPIYVRNNLIFSPANTAPLFSTNQVATFHDASVYGIPEAYSFLFRLKYKLIFTLIGKKAKKIITVSNFSKKELNRYCGIDQKKIEIITHGFEHLLSTASDCSIFDKYSIKDKPYFLLVGSKSKHKNIYLVFEANRLLDNNQYNILDVGGSYSKVFQKTEEKKNNNIIEIGYVTDEQLRAIYSNALCLIFPSLYEGFGFPVLEALSFSCPVLCSNSASLAEFGEELVTYFDPTDPIELSTLMREKLLQLKNEPVNFELLQNKYSWKKAALKTWEILSSLL